PKLDNRCLAAPTTPGGALRTLTCSTNDSYQLFHLARQAVADETALVSPVSIETATRCVAGRVTVVTTAANASDAAAAVTLSSAFGGRTVTVGAGKSASVAFGTRQAQI